MKLARGDEPARDSLSRVGQVGDRGDPCVAV